MRAALSVGVLSFAVLSAGVMACGSSSASAVATGDDGGSPGDGASPQDAGSSSDGSRSGDASLDSAADATSGDDGGAPDAAGDAGTMRTMEVTFYGWDDNSPPGNAIAYPKSSGFPTVHDAAGGTGTYADPITFATDKSELPRGTLVYAPFIEKYLVMEDDCGQCDTDWAGSMKWHIDVWMNSNGTETASALLACEDQWTQNATTVEVDPPPGRTVTTSPLFDPSTNTCRTSP